MYACPCLCQKVSRWFGNSTTDSPHDRLRNPVKDRRGASHNSSGVLMLNCWDKFGPFSLNAFFSATVLNHLSGSSLSSTERQKDAFCLLSSSRREVMLSGLPYAPAPCSWHRPYGATVPGLPSPPHSSGCRQGGRCGTVLPPSCPSVLSLLLWMPVVGSDALLDVCGCRSDRCLRGDGPD